MKILDQVIALTTNLSMIKLAHGKFDTEQEQMTYIAGLAFIEAFVKMSKSELNNEHYYKSEARSM